jgi:membrane protein DedA with SNARE-associated domain
VKEFILDYLTALGIGGILISSFIEALGVPFFPGGIMVILAGFLIPKGYMSFPAALLATASGFITGSLVAYFLGAKLGGQVFERGGRWLRVTAARLDKARLYLSRSAPGFVIFGRFIPGVSNLTPYLAGVGGLRLEVFFALTAAFAFAWAALYLSLGMLFGQNWGKVAERIQPLLLAGAMAGLGLYCGFFLRRKKG